MCNNISHRGLGDRLLLLDDIIDSSKSWLEVKSFSEWELLLFNSNLTKFYSRAPNWRLASLWYDNDLTWDIDSEDLRHM